MFSSDTAAYLADFGSPVTWAPTAGGAQVVGTMIFDQPEQAVDGGDTLSRGYMVTFETAAWPGLVRGEVLVIGGDGKGGSFKLRTDPRAGDDGEFSAVHLTKVAP